jgi:hypothetical protein
MTEAMTAPIRERLDAEQTRLKAVEDELASVQAKAEETGAAIGGLEGINPALKIDMTALDTALAKLALIRAYQFPAEGTAAPEVSGADGQRAKGGPMSPGRTYLVGEQGPELVTPTRSGYVHPNGTGGGGTSIGGVTVHAPMHFHGVSAADAEELFQRFSRRLSQELGNALRGSMSDPIAN